MCSSSMRATGASRGGGELFASGAASWARGPRRERSNRDTATVAKLAIPVWSSGFAPNAYAATAEPIANPVLDMGGVRVAPGDLIVGDDDGLVVGTARSSRRRFRGRARSRTASPRCSRRSWVAPLFDHFS